MTKRSLSVLVLAAGALATGCGDDDWTDVPPTGLDYITAPAGFAAAQQAVAASDLCSGTTAHRCDLAQHPPTGATTTEIIQPEAGKLCLKGKVGAGGWAELVVSYTHYNGGPGKPPTEVLQSFNADALGITQVSFNVDSPPAAGIAVEGIIVAQLSCPDRPQDCRTGNFELTGDPASIERMWIKDAGTIVQPFTNFVQTDPAHNSSTFDTSMLDGFGFWVNTGTYDFCISDFKFLDANGDEVTPS